MPGQPPYPRKQYLVDRGYQLRFAARLFGVILAVAVVTALTASALVWNRLYAPDQDARLLVVALITIAATLLVELLVAIPLVFFLGVRQSHRVIGPMNRLKRALQAIGQGDFSQRVQLRQGDALEDLGRSINKMAESLQKRR